MAKHVSDTERLAKAVRIGMIVTGEAVPAVAGSAEDGAVGTPDSLNRATRARMLFNSLIFPVFLAAFLPLYFLTSGRARLWVCLIASYIFYGWWDWRFLSLLAGSTLAAFTLGILLGSARSPGRRKALVVAAVAISLGCLGYFKYANFFTTSLQAGLESLGFSPSIGTLDVILPVGISFYIFQSLSYTIDVSRGHLAPERSLLRFATYLAFFPQLVAGPILRASDFMPQLASDRKPDWSMAVSGLNLVLLGFVYKVVMADSLAGPVDDRFGNPLGHGWASLALGVVFYAFQIYGDFCGYTAIAIGIGRILGFDLGRNFDRPYFSASFSEFWTRWHISLSSWLRDYLYIPLGGNRLGRLRTMFNLLATMLIGGLWHGAGWNFVLWGGLHGLYLILQRLAGGPWGRLATALRIPHPANRLLLVLLTFILTCLAWIPFRSVSIDDAWLIARRIATAEGSASIPGAFGAVKGLSIVLLIVLLEAVSFRVDFVALLRRHPVLNIAYAIGCLLLLAIAGTYAGHAFIYFQF